MRTRAKTNALIFLVALAAAGWFTGWLVFVAGLPEAWGAFQPAILMVAIFGMIPFLALAHRLRGSGKKNPYDRKD